MKELLATKLPAATLSACSALSPSNGIDYKASYHSAEAALGDYHQYQMCIEEVEDKPLPPIIELIHSTTDEKKINAYSHYVNELLDYIHHLKTQCQPPVIKKLPIYK